MGGEVAQEVLVGSCPTSSARMCSRADLCCPSAFQCKDSLARIRCEHFVLGE